MISYPILAIVAVLSVAVLLAIGADDLAPALNASES